MKLPVLLLILVIPVACVPRRARMRPPPPPCGPVVLTIIDATIDPTKPNGQPWDTAAQRFPFQLLFRSAIAVLAPSPRSTMSLAVSLIRTIQDANRPASFGPDPVVRVSIAGTNRATPIQPSTSNPVWNYPTLVHIDSREDIVTFSVFDVDQTKTGLALDPIGSVTLPAMRLCRPAVHSLGPAGSLRQLTVATQHYSQKHQARRTVHVRADQQWTPTGITLIQGQQVDVIARGQACGAPGQCVGPEGFAPPIGTDFNVVQNTNHCALIGRIDEAPSGLLGASRSFTVAGTGQLFLGPNDTDVRNNSGGFDVEIVAR